jgi:hypothetical protein
LAAGARDTQGPHPDADACHEKQVYAFLQVLETLKDPIQTLVLGREPEIVYAVLSNFLVLAQRYPVVFSQVSSSKPGAAAGSSIGALCAVAL